MHQSMQPHTPQQEDAPTPPWRDGENSLLARSTSAHNRLSFTIPLPPSHRRHPQTRNEPSQPPPRSPLYLPGASTALPKREKTRKPQTGTRGQVQPRQIARWRPEGRYAVSHSACAVTSSSAAVGRAVTVTAGEVRGCSGGAVPVANACGDL